MKKNVESAMKPNAPDLISMVRAARRQYRPGTGTVYDKLLRQAGSNPLWLADELRSTCGVETVNAEEVVADFSLLNSATATAWRCVVLRCVADNVLRLGAEDPWDEALLYKASMYVGQPLTPAAVTFADLCRWLGRDGRVSIRSEPAIQIASATVVAANSPGPADAGEPWAHSASVSLVRTGDDAQADAVVKFADEAIAAALASGSSDIHFECDRDGVTVKHRRDGVMASFARLEGTQMAEEVISRIKGLAQLDVAERRVPQDGRFRYRAADSNVDLRVSIMPSVYGEDAALRLLDKSRLCDSTDTITLESLGIDAEHALAIRQLAAQPTGMLLVAGPAGSGKTTTLYAALSAINTGREKIVTIEDPVEYELPGVLQIPVNERRGLTFARGLRSILRHDPDRILVGEIRDAETAETAVQSALAGHVVFTTVHANGVTDVVGRFRHFALDMFGFMSVLNGVVLQRLVRRVCHACRGTRDATTPEREWLARLGQHKLVSVAHAAGCAHCHGSGYRGRTVLAEVHRIDDTGRDLVTQGASMSVLKQHMYREGVEPLAPQAARRVCAGETTIEEIRRVVGWL